MTWYYIFPFFVLLLTFLGYKKPKVGSFILFLFLFFSMFRGDNVGVDTMNNMDERSLLYRSSLGLSDISGDSIGRSAELFYLLLVRFVVHNNLPPRVMIYLFSIITFLFLLLAFKRYKANVALGCLFYFLSNHYLFSMAAARQMAAVSILLFASSFLFEETKKRYFFFLWVFIASLMHLSSLIFFILYLLRFITIKKSVVFSTLFFVFLIFSFVPFDISIILSQLGMFAFSEVYASQANYSGEGLSIFGFLFKALLFAGAMYVFLTRNGKENTDLSDNLFLFSIMVSCVFSLSSMAAGRITYIFSIYQCVYYANYFCKFNRLKYNTSSVVYLGLFMLNYIQIMLWVPALKSPYYMSFSLQ